MARARRKQKNAQFLGHRLSFLRHEQGIVSCHFYTNAKNVGKNLCNFSSYFFLQIRAIFCSFSRGHESVVSVLMMTESLSNLSL